MAGELSISPPCPVSGVPVMVSFPNGINFSHCAAKSLRSPKILMRAPPIIAPNKYLEALPDDCPAFVVFARRTRFRERQFFVVPHHPPKQRHKHDSKDAPRH